MPEVLGGPRGVGASYEQGTPVSLHQHGTHKPDSGLDLQAKVLKTSQVVPTWLGSPHRAPPPALLSAWRLVFYYCTVEQPAPTPHLARPGGCAALRIVQVTVPCVSRSCEHFPDGFDLHLLSAIRLQGYLNHKKLPPPQDRHRTLGIVLL